MARYIDADELYKKIFPLDVVDKRHYSINAKAVAEAIDKTPTADVAPRYEVAREIFEEIEILKQSCVKTELFRGAWFDMRAFEEGISELKKKYTEDETDPPKGD